MRALLAGFLVLIGLLPVGGLSAATLDEGLSAYRAKDYSVAFDVFDTLSRQGDTRATFYLSLLYTKGLGVVENPGYGVQLLRRAAEAGDPLAQYNLGNRYMREGTEEFAPEQAAAWWKKAADQGLVPAQHNLGSLYALGTGVKRDLKQARHWYAKAAANGSERSAEALQEIGGAGVSKPARGQTAPPVADVAQAGLVNVTPAWIAEKGNKGVTLQLAASRERAGIERLAKRYRFKRPLLLYRISAAKGAIWALGYGLFPDAAAANRSLPELPAKLQQAGPWPRRLKDIRNRLVP